MWPTLFWLKTVVEARDKGNSVVEANPNAGKMFWKEFNHRPYLLNKKLKIFHFRVCSEQELFIKKLKEWKIIVL